jgi:hypothetical protein
MPIFSDGTRRARQDLIAARRHLAATAAASDKPTDAYRDANDAVIEAEKALPAWKRLDIDAGVHDDTDGA